MSTREKAYSIFQQLTDDELEGFVLIFGRLHPQKGDDIGNRRKIFESLEQLCRPMPDLDYERELDEYPDKLLSMLYI